ncbi:alpha/beta hydrolase [Salisediminibacterium selenitireducens]|uniref:Alpha/beta hydrolase n=1 Tax=Bacillus selenitireducens (strain ATCC 700615 / DSM 15326 / MLS10) TaxID=439292 RepID=D6XTE1_BACIE|nr:hypothetical protein [Salisediminibacterium selenitireducens]ADH99077.1 hypothetical protein Bsel_1565 [[Bacillus] selenitireducens MLS10]
MTTEPSIHKKETKRERAIRWMIQRWHARNNFDPASPWLSSGVFLTGLILMIITASGNPSGLGIAVDSLIHMAVFSFVYWGVVWTGGLLLSMFYIPVPRETLLSLLISGYIAYRVFSEGNIEDPFVYAVSVGWILGGLAFGILIAVLVNVKHRSRPKTLFYAAVPASVLVGLIMYHPTAPEYEQIVTSDYTVTELDEVHDLDDPLNSGVYGIETFTYGPGGDVHRTEFRHQMDVVTASVDGSHYIDDWSRGRTFFWGFDESELPLNGRVWLPDSDAGEKHPVVLMVHGNHRMEHFSDDGYTYLGETLASKGYIAVSVDQNFLNFSGYTGIPSENYTLRPWILMQHLLEFKRHQEESKDNAFKKMDLDSVSLIGHSRGGQAVSMVADYERFFADDDTVSGMEKIGLDAVIAIAPTDRQVNDQRPRLEGVHYLTLHGAHDGDVHNFRGDRQFMRTNVDSAEEVLYKASVYFTEGNHSQFNEDWGRSDLSLPGGVFMNRRHLMSPDDQRDATALFIAAFLDLTVGGQADLELMFKDPGTVPWLPDSGFLTRFDSSESETLVAFDAGSDAASFRDGGESEFKGFYETEVRNAEDRMRNTKATRGLVMGSRDNGSWRAILSSRIKERVEEKDGGSIGISLANLGFELEEDGLDHWPWNTSPVIAVSLGLSNGERLTVRSDQFHHVYPPVFTQYSRYPGLDESMRGDKYSQPAEGVFHVYHVPIDRFQEQSDHFTLSALESLEIEVVDGPAKIMIDWIKWYPE